MLSIRLDNDTKYKLKKISQQQNISKSQLVRESINYYIELLESQKRKRSSYELGKKLFGKYGSGVGDLSTTYKQRIKKKIYAKNSHR